MERRQGQELHQGEIECQYNDKLCPSAEQQQMPQPLQFCLWEQAGESEASKMLQ